MVVLKNLPSNIVKEAYVILKPNQKIKKNIEKKEDENKIFTSDYVVKEAEMVVSNYLSTMEDNKKLRNLEVEKIKNKYNKLKKVSLTLAGIILLNLLINLMWKML